MTEPKRWLEDGAPEHVARLLEAARNEQPSGDGLQRTLVSLGLGVGASAIAKSVAAGAATGAASLTKTALITGTFVKWGLVGFVATLSVGAVIQRVIQHGEEPVVKPSQTNGAVTSPVVADAPSREPSLTSSAAPHEVERNEGRTTPTPPAIGRAERAQPRPQEPIDAEQLAEEVQAIDRARAALAQNRPAEVLRVLDEYDARFGRRRLLPEALYLRMEALLASGQSVAAREVARRLLATAPNGPHSARARIVLH